MNKIQHCKKVIHPIIILIITLSFFCCTMGETSGKNSNPAELSSIKKLVNVVDNEYGIINVDTIPENIEGTKSLEKLFDGIEEWPDCAIISFNMDENCQDLPLIIKFEFSNVTTLTGIDTVIAGIDESTQNAQYDWEISYSSSWDDQFTLIKNFTSYTEGEVAIEFDTSVSAKVFMVSIHRMNFDQVEHVLELIPVIQSNLVDVDHDGIHDPIEDELIEKYAPEVRLHSNEDKNPSPVSWYINRIKMGFEAEDVPDGFSLGVGRVTVSNMTEQSIFGEYSDIRTEKSHFFLQIPNNRDEKKTRRGVNNPSEWECYAHVYAQKDADNAFVSDNGKTFIYVQYWFFYPYNDKLGIPVEFSNKRTGSHEGDWECVIFKIDSGKLIINPEDTISVDASQTQLEKAFYAAHNNGQIYQPGELKRNSQGRIIVYSANNSHASYNKPGIHPRVAFDYTDNKGKRWDCVNNTINVGEKEFPMNNQNWLNYSGRWGEIGAKIPDWIPKDVRSMLSFSGPYGPVFQGKWLKTF